VVGAMYSVPHHQEAGRSDSSIARNPVTRRKGPDWGMPKSQVRPSPHSYSSLSVCQLGRREERRVNSLDLRTSRGCKTWLSNRCPHLRCPATEDNKSWAVRGVVAGGAPISGAVRPSEWVPSLVCWQSLGFQSKRLRAVRLVPVGLDPRLMYPRALLLTERARVVSQFRDAMRGKKAV